VITIIDCGTGNLGSVCNMIRRVGGVSRLSSDPDEIRRADKIILPGVGSFDNGMAALNGLGLSEAVREAAIARGSYLLGICLGMQLLMEESEEGSLPGLGLMAGSVRRFRLEDLGLRVPHMGWNEVVPVGESRLIPSSEGLSRFYFVHSYYAVCEESSDVSAITNYGHDFASAYERENLMGVQFHPEKSHRFGMALFERFRNL
jgi:imidazole glycerol-phosphate synthase subunit HisH